VQAPRVSSQRRELSSTGEPAKRYARGDDEQHDERGDELGVHGVGSPFVRVWRVRRATRRRARVSRAEELWRTHPRTSRERPWVSLSPAMVINGNLYAVSARNSVFAVDAAPAPPVPDQQR